MGKIHIYCGDGKGKTTASIGLAIRAMGSGWSVIFVQFLKGSQTGELEIFKGLNKIKVIRGDKPAKFTFQMNEQELSECKKINQELFNQAITEDFNDHTLLILDEAVGTIDIGLLEKDAVIEFLKSKPKCEVVLTGRNPRDELLELADYVTEMRKVKHPYDEKLEARKGIEY